MLGLQRGQTLQRVAVETAGEDEAAAGGGVLLVELGRSRESQSKAVRAGLKAVLNRPKVTEFITRLTWLRPFITRLTWLRPRIRASRRAIPRPTVQSRRGSLGVPDGITSL